MCAWHEGAEDCELAKDGPGMVVPECLLLHKPTRPSASRDGSKPTKTTCEPPMEARTVSAGAASEDSMTCLNG
jgi:hypothetical protein